ncbi:hypothetical protein A2U01_0076930, partial [Trifolium medium]|nr:hypothetical protein [Trifolium medium]
DRVLREVARETSTAEGGSALNVCCVYVDQT